MSPLAGLTGLLGGTLDLHLRNVAACGAASWGFWTLLFIKPFDTLALVLAYGMAVIENTSNTVAHVSTHVSIDLFRLRRGVPVGYSRAA